MDFVICVIVIKHSYMDHAHIKTREVRLYCTIDI